MAHTRGGFGSLIKALDGREVATVSLDDDVEDITQFSDDPACSKQ